MAKPKAPLQCPNCEDTLVAARVPTDKEYAKAFDREEPGTLPHGSDTASPDQRAKLGALYRCRNCGYNTRIKDEGGAAAEPQ